MYTSGMKTGSCGSFCKTISGNSLCSRQSIASSGVYTSLPHPILKISLPLKKGMILIMEENQASKVITANLV